MSGILGITFPIYAGLAIGWLIVRMGWFTAADMRMLGKYVLNVALPALLFMAVATRDLAEVIRPGYMLAFLLGGLATLVLAWCWFSAAGYDPARRAVAVMGSTCPNSGFVGFPVMLLAFPDIAALVLAQNFLIENLVLIPICLALMDAAGAKPAPLLRRLGGIILDVLRRPLVIALLAGVAVSALGLSLPAPVERVGSMLAASASAPALLVIGGSLVGLPLKGNQVLTAQIAAGKLLLHPAMVALAVVAVTAAGLALPPDLRAAVILSAAMPIFGVYVVFAQQVGREGLASIALILSTVSAFVTLTALLVWLA